VTAADSGTAECPITYRAAPGAEARLTGGRAVDNFIPVTDPGVLARLDTAARGHVLQADLKAMASPTTASRTGTSAAERRAWICFSRTGR